MVTNPWYYALRLIEFSAIILGIVYEFFYVIWRLMLQLAETFGKGR